jgi:hypothetical protein
MISSAASEPRRQQWLTRPICLMTMTAGLVALAATTALLLAGGRDDVDRGEARELAALPVSVTVDTHHPGRRVANRFLGLSFEVGALHDISAYAHGGNLVGLLRSLGPGVLRFGGVSADTRVAWTDRRTARPAWASTAVGPDDLRRVGRLAALSDWHVLMTVGLVHYDPAAAAREVAVATAALGRRLAAIEVGNEPDAYAKHNFRALPWTARQYGAEVRRYRHSISRVARGIPFAGPGVSGSKVFARWGRAEAAALRPVLLTGHHYPLGCHQTPPPTIDRLLSPEIRVLEGQSLRRFMAVSRSSSIPVRLDEVGSVSCGGTPGISNTFASALWATGYIADAMSAGVAGINLEGNPSSCQGYSPVCTATPGRVASALGVQPQWYALLLMKALIGTRPVPTRISTPGAPNLLVRAFISPRRSLRVVIVNDDPPGSRPAELRLRVARGSRTATVLALSGPSPAATTGVRLGGRAVAPDGSWRGAVRARIAPVRGVVKLTVAPSSAALLTVPARASGR